MEAVFALFNLLSRHLLRETGEIHENFIPYGWCFDRDWLPRSFRIKTEDPYRSSQRVPFFTFQKNLLELMF